MATRGELRKKIMIILYQIDIYEERHIDYEIDQVIQDNIDKQEEFVHQIVYGVMEKKDQLDSLANSLMKDWTIERIDKNGAAILRMALSELKYTNTPEAVVINEAVVLAKEYSDDAVRKIINAVLDKVVKG